VSVIDGAGSSAAAREVLSEVSAAAREVLSEVVMPVARKKKLHIVIRLMLTGYTVLGGCIRFVCRLMFAMFRFTAMLCG